MGGSVSCVQVITRNKVKQICPSLTAALFSELKKYKVSFEDFAMFISNNAELTLEHIQDEDEKDRIQGMLVDLWANLQSSFYKRSKGLTLELGYHNSLEDGDPDYDQVDGAFFHVGKMYQLTSAGKEFIRSVKTRHFVRQRCGVIFFTPKDSLPRSFLGQASTINQG